MGMGTGKVAVQAFLQFPTLSRVYGVEISLGRYRVAERAALNLAGFWPNLFEVERHVLQREPQRREAARRRARNSFAAAQLGFRRECRSHELLFEQLPASLFPP